MNFKAPAFAGARQFAGAQWFEQSRICLPHGEPSSGRTYLGVTNNLAKRAWEHRNGVGSEYATEHDCKLLVWFELFDDIQYARHRELQMKKWRRPWKIDLIEKENPKWSDLYVTTQWN